MSELNEPGTPGDDGKPPVTPPEDPGAGAPPEVEKRARQLGWRPPEEFNEGMTNPPAEFLSAEDYVKKAEDTPSILRERNRKLGDRLEKMEAQLQTATGKIDASGQRVTDLTTLVDDLHKMNVETGKRAYDRARREIETKRDQAAEDGEGEVYREAQKELQDLEAEKPPERPAEPAKEPAVAPPAEKKPAADAELSPAATTWIGENQDIMSDRKLNPIAVSIHTANMTPKADGGEGMTEAQSLAATRKEIRELYPKKFENQRRQEPSPVSGSGSPPPRKVKNGFDDLPAEAKATYHRLNAHFVAKKRTYTPEQYAKDYYLENGDAS